MEMAVIESVTTKEKEGVRFIATDEEVGVVLNRKKIG